MTDIIIEKNVPVPMRDGVRLCADIYRPSRAGRYPVVLERTPYDKTEPRMLVHSMHAMRAVDAGYAVVIQDCRGRFGSEGEFAPFLTETQDGYDSVEWCADQSWSNGRVGMYGTSYAAATQLLAAIASPPHLYAICPAQTGADFHDGWIYQGGAFKLAFTVHWAAQFLAIPQLDRMALSPEQRQAHKERILDDLGPLRRTLSHMPLADLPMLKLPGLAPYYHDWLQHPDDDAYWQRWNIPAHHERIAAPALHIGGWYDLFESGPLRNFEGLKRQAATQRARDGQRLIMGPWIHSSPATAYSIIGERDFGWRCTLPSDELQFAWFDHWLKDIDNGVASQPPVRLYVMNSGWRYEDEWPLERTQWTRFHLHSQARANTLGGDGRLSPDPPGSEPPDVFLYNPLNPVPTTGAAGIFDQRPVQARSDVLVYSTPPLKQPLEVTGPISVVLYASSSAPDTDFTAKLVDVAPSGYAANLCDGILRARYRNSPARAELMQPGEVYQFTIDLIATSNLFAAGHQIRLEISSSNFPRFDRNPNTGDLPAIARETRPAMQTVFHDSRYPSYLLLPVIPQKGTV